MPDSNALFNGSIPEAYDRYLVSVLFEPYATDLANRVPVNPKGAVLELACGTGILTQALRTHLPATVPIVATDLGQDMLDFARRARGTLENVEWKQADATVLPFDSASFAAVACQFGVMFFPDKLKAFRQARRVLNDDGVFLFNVWGDLAHNEFARLAHETLANLYPDNPPNFYTVPYGFNDPEVLRRLLTESNFGSVEIQTVTMEARSASARDLAIGYIAGTPASTAVRERGGDIEAIVDTLTDAYVRLGGDNPFHAPMQALVVTAHAVGA